MSEGSGVVVGRNDNVHEQEVNGDGNAEPTVPTISLRDVDSDATGVDDMSDHEVVHVARRRLVLLGLDDQMRGSRGEDQTHASPSSDTESLISRDGHSEGEEDPEPTLSPEPPFPIVSVQLETFTLASVDLETMFAQRACLIFECPGVHEGVLQVGHDSCVGRDRRGTQSPCYSAHVTTIAPQTSQGRANPEGPIAT